jgi:hypothetical protein
MGHVHALSRTETEYRVAGVGAMTKGKTKDFLKSDVHQRAGPSVAGALCQNPQTAGAVCSLAAVVSTAAVRRGHSLQLD